MARAARWPREALPLLALVALVLPALLGRAGLESSLWMDEVHSLGMAQLPPARIVDAAARDAHPPGYFLALSAWLAVGRRLGVEGLAWARGLGVVAWLALALAVWGLVRRLAGRRAAGPAVWAVAGGAAAAQAAVELRGYFVVFAAAVVGFLVVLVAEEEAAAGRWRRAAAWWSLYAALAAAALWTHLLAAPLFALLGAAWVAGLARHVPAASAWSPGASAARPRRAGSSGFGVAAPGGAAGGGRRLALGTAAHLAAALAWSPWLVRVPGQLATLSRLDTGWMTPATPGNLGLVFARWFPFGRAAAPERWPDGVLALLGMAAVLVPLAGWGWSRRTGARRHGLDRGAPQGQSRAALHPGVALAAAIGFPFLLWCLARFELAAVFHGPRYPTLAAGLWALAIAGLALAAASRPWLLLAPWLAAAAVGHLLALRQEARGGLPAARPAIEAALVAELPALDPLYVSPSELAPFVRKSLAGIVVRPVEEVACGLVERGRAAVLDLDPWPSLERSRDRVWRRAANRGLLAADRRWQELPAPALRATLLSMAGAGPEAAALCARSLAPPRPWSAAPAAVALPEDQLHADGWSVPELGRDLVPRRWATSPVATLRFDRPLPPGRHTLHLVAHRAPAPRPVEEICVRPPGATGESCFPEPAGRLAIALPFTLSRPLRRPEATLRHPVWSPAGSLGSGDRRRLTVQLEVAWIDSDPPEP